MKARLSLGGMVFLALFLAVSGPVAAQQTFQQSDLGGDWSIYVYGGYDAYTESFYGNLNLNTSGGLMTGLGYWRSIESFMIQGQLILDAAGGVSGTLRCEHSNWHIIFGRMSQRKNEIIAVAEGKRYLVVVHMIRSNGEPASLPGDEVIPPEEETQPEETPPEDTPEEEEEDPPQDDDDDGGSSGGGGSSGIRN